MKPPTNFGDVEQRGPHRPSQSEIDEKPWKYLGYPYFSRYLAGAPDRLLLRRFDTLHSRVFLIAQDEICQLENELRTLDEKYSGDAGGWDLDNGTIRGDMADRKELLGVIREKLDHYDRQYLQYCQMMSRQRPAKWRVQNLRTWLQNNHRAISDNEVDFLDQIYEEELLGIADKNRSRLATWLDSFFIWLSKKDRYDWFKRSEPDMDAIHKETVFTSDDDKVDALLENIYFWIGVCYLIAPLWLLQSLESFSTNSKLGIITAFILSFIVLLWMATTAGPLRVLAGAAAYSAVLVAFLQPAERPGPPPS